jgi:hypothetical protein
MDLILRHMGAMLILALRDVNVVERDKFAAKTRARQLSDIQTGLPISPTSKDWRRRPPHCKLLRRRLLITDMANRATYAWSLC